MTQLIKKINLHKTLIFLLLIITDLLSKYYIFNNIDLYQFIEITSFLDITHIHNFGISFGLFSNTVPSIILIILGMFVTLFVVYLFIISNENLESWGLFIIICGAIGNIIDRSINGYVIDFIYFHINQLYWPAFNFADIYISIGIITILINMVKKTNK